MVAFKIILCFNLHSLCMMELRQKSFYLSGPDFESTTAAY